MSSHKNTFEINGKQIPFRNYEQKALYDNANKKDLMNKAIEKIKSKKEILMKPKSKKGTIIFTERETIKIPKNKKPELIA